MMKLAWLTDLHLNFLNTMERFTFYQTIVDKKPDALLISGDIAEASSICNLLKEMVHQIDRPIYFVLGNHDYYKGSITQVRTDVTILTQMNKLLNWLPYSGIQKLAPDILLVGTDGFADGRYGDYENSHVSLNDSYLIAELYQEKLLSRTHLKLKMQQLADNDARQLQRDLKISLQTHSTKKVIILTHVTPFPEVCTYLGNPTDSNFLPFFSSKTTGDVLLEIAREYPSIEFYTFCGHTHNYAHSQVLPNLIVTVGAAEYYQPAVQNIVITSSLKIEN